jgi:hypothetical protein
MLSEEKIKKMIRLSDYEKGMGATDLRRTHYAKTDYVLLQVLKTVVSVALAGCLTAFLFVMYHADSILNAVFPTSYKIVLIVGACIFAALLIFGVVVTIIRASKLYVLSDMRAEEYGVTLHELLELYEKEEQGQEEEL